MANSYRYLLPVITAFVLLLMVPDKAQAQDPDMRVGVGGQIGDPSGISFKFYEEPNLSYDILLAIDLTDDFIFLNIHRTWEEELEQAIRFFYGPGLLLGVDSDDEPPQQNQMLTGVSFTGGLVYFIERFEIFVNITPRLTVLPATRGNIGGGGGLRYYF